MILYLDASSFVAFYLRERRRYDTVSDLRNRAEQMASSVIAYPEIRSAFARALRDRSRQPSLSPDDYDVAVEGLNLDWPGVFDIDADESLVLDAGEIAAKYAIRGYDSVHLTSALRLRETNAGQVLFSTWDRALADAAEAAGLSLALEVTT